MASIIEAAPYYTTAQMLFDIRPFVKGQFVSVRYTRTVKNIDGEMEDLFNVWCGSGQEFPSELFSRAMHRFTI